MDQVCFKECAKDFLKEYLSVKVNWFHALRACGCRKKPFSASTKGCMVLLALALGYLFYLIRTSIICSYIAQSFKVGKLWHFLF